MAEKDVEAVRSKFVTTNQYADRITGQVVAQPPNFVRNLLDGGLSNSLTVDKRFHEMTAMAGAISPTALFKQMVLYHGMQNTAGGAVPAIEVVEGMPLMLPPLTGSDFKLTCFRTYMPEDYENGDLSEYLESARTEGSLGAQLEVIYKRISNMWREGNGPRAKAIHQMFIQAISVMLHAKKDYRTKFEKMNLVPSVSCMAMGPIEFPAFTTPENLEFHITQPIVNTSFDETRIRINYSMWLDVCRRFGIGEFAVPLFMCLDKEWGEGKNLADADAIYRYINGIIDVINTTGFSFSAQTWGSKDVVLKMLAQSIVLGATYVAVRDRLSVQDLVFEVGIKGVFPIEPQLSEMYMNSWWNQMKCRGAPNAAGSVNIYAFPGYLKDSKRSTPGYFGVYPINFHANGEAEIVMAPSLIPAAGWKSAAEPTPLPSKAALYDPVKGWFFDNDGVSSIMDVQILGSTYAAWRRRDELDIPQEWELDIAIPSSDSVGMGMGSPTYLSLFKGWSSHLAGNIYPVVNRAAISGAKGFNTKAINFAIEG